MKKTGIFYGSSSGTTEDVAQRIAGRLGVGAADIYNVSDASARDAEPYEVFAVAPGTAVITVETEEGGYTATCNVTVEPQNPDGTETLPSGAYVNYSQGVLTVNTPAADG